MLTRLTALAEGVQHDNSTSENSTMMTSILGHTYELVGFALILLTTTYVWWKRQNDKFSWTDFTYAFPIFGKIHRLSRGSRADRSVDKQGLTPAENQLMHDYSVHLGATDRSAFARAMIFLKLTGQDNRRPTPLIMLPLLFILLLAEALGFSFLLAPFIAAEITPNQAQVIGVIVAFVLAVIAAGLTHAAGAQWYERGLYGKMRAAARDHGVRMFEQQITPADDQEMDASAKYPTRFGNRVFETEYDKPGMAVIVAAIIYIVAIAVVSTGVRYENLHLALSKQSALQSDGSSAGGDPFASSGASTSDLPPAVAQNAQSAQKRVLAEENGERLMRGIAGITGLGVIFIFTQVFSTYMGLRFGYLNAKRVVDAYRLTGGYLDYPEYERHELTPKILVVEARLRTLRRKLYDDHGRADGKSSITFKQWLSAQQEQPVYRPVPAPNPALLARQTEATDSVRPSSLDAAQIRRLAQEILDLPQVQRKGRLMELNAKLRPVEINALRVALSDEKSVRAENERLKSSNPEPWMEEI